MQIEEKLCSICQRNSPIYICNDCLLHRKLCQSCQELCHNSISKKNHDFKEIHEKGIEDTLKEFPNCKTHSDEKLKFVCLNCKEIICPECSILGVHNSHKIKKVDEVSIDLINTLKTYKDKYMNSTKRAKKLMEFFDTKTRTIIRDLKNCKEHLNSTFEKIEAELKKKKNILISVVDECEINKKKYFELIESDLIKIIQDADKIDQLTQNNPPSILSTSLYKDLVYLSENPAEKRNDEIKLIEEKITDLGAITKIEIDSNSILEAIRSIKIQPNNSLEKQFKLVQTDDQIIINSNLNLYSVIGVNNSSQDILNSNLEKRNVSFNMKNLSNYNELLLSFDSPWNYKVIKEFRDPLKMFLAIKEYKPKSGWSFNVTDYSTVFKDYRRGLWYLGYHYDNVKKLEEYSNLEDLFDHKNSKTIILENGYDGTYVVANNGVLYHTISNSDFIAKSSLSDGKTLEKLYIQNAGYRNTFDFTWGGFSDIALFIDELTLKLYVLYQCKGEAHARVTEILDSPCLAAGRTWILHNIDKRSISFAFIYAGNLFIGLEGSRPIIKIQIELENFRITREISIIIPGGNNVPHIFYDAENQSMIVSEYGMISRYFNS